MRRVFLIWFFIAAFLSALIGDPDGANAGERKFTWTFRKHGSVSTWYWPYYVAWMDYVTKQTGGAIRFEVKSGGELPYKSEDAGWITTQRKVDLAYTWDVHQGGWRDWMDVPSLPGLYANRAEAIKSSLEVVVPFWNKLGEKEGFRVLHCANDVPDELFATFDIKSVGDLKGKKIRASSLGLQAIVRELSAVPVSVTFPEVVMAAERGMIDGATTSINSGVSGNWQEAFKVFYTTGFSFARELVLINRSALLELPKEWQELVIDSSRKMLTDALNAEQEKQANVSKGKLIAAGGKIIEPTASDREAIRTAGLRVQQEWLKRGGRSSEAKELYNLIVSRR
jgi:TRAP-type C4-dicarboxylate transport system substrate-binding protein